MFLWKSSNHNTSWKIPEKTTGKYFAVQTCTCMEQVWIFLIIKSRTRAMQ